MTNKEKYKQAFSVLHASDDISLEVNKMNKFKKTFHMKTAAAGFLCLLLLTGGITAYAADVGGIREIVRVWIDGKSQDVELTSDGDGGYQFTIQRDDGEDIIGAGGVEIARNGEERPLSAEEVAETLNEDVEVKDDGSVWLYYYSHAVDITQYIVDGKCKVALDDNGTMIYYDIEVSPDGGSGYSTSSVPVGDASDYVIVK